MVNKIDFKAKNLTSNVGITIYGIYSFFAICVLILAAYSIYCNYAFWEGLWHGSYISLLTPFVFNTFVAVALGVGTIPMVLACTAFYKFNNIAKSKHRFLKGLIIWLPACVCFFSLLVLFHEIFIAGTLHVF